MRVAKAIDFVSDRHRGESAGKSKDSSVKIEKWTLRGKTEK
jgi:hypothetical protein